MALTNTSQDVEKNYEDSENTNGDRGSESPKVAVRGRGAWKPTPKPLLPSQVMTLKPEAPKEIEIMRFGVPCFGRRGEGEESDGEEGGESGFGSGEPKIAAKLPVRKDLSDASIERETRKEVLLAEKDAQKLGETWDLGHPKDAEEPEGAQRPKDPEEQKETQGPKRSERPTEPNAEEEVRRVKENAVRKLRSKLEQISESKPQKSIYQSPTTERKPFLMKGQSKLPARIRASKIWVRELSEGPRTPTIASKLKWVSRRPSSPTTPEEKRQTTPPSARSCSKSVISPGSRASTPTPILRAQSMVRSRTPTGRLLFPPSEPPPRRPSSASELEHGANPSPLRGSSSKRRAPVPLIPVVPQEHILRLASVLECDPEREVEDMSPPPVPEVASKPEVWNNRMRKEELCPSCRRCVVKFEFVCGDMICGGCYDRLLKESGKGNMRCIACRAIVG
ncbi:hypothetical protein HOY80DRAFT_938142 [Tuber brumale]|nr:hypothetical protein HOY80DRAFT_938142 [Tuber brumale]